MTLSTSTPAHLPGSPSAALGRDLSLTIAGRVSVPGDPDFDELTIPFNVAAISPPSAAIEVVDAADVAAVIGFAAANGFDVAVQATGHGAVPRTRPTLLVVTRLLDTLTIDGSGLARIGAGVRWSQVIDAATPLGLAAPVGSAPAVGVVGYVTGGGIGPISRGLGFASDLVSAFEVVTGAGELVRATATTHSDIFWALRGGKGAVGIVTAVELQLVRIDGLYGGALFFAESDIRPVAHEWLRWAATLPAQATTSVAILRLPPMPGVPEPLAGRCTLSIRFAWTGDPEEGAALFSPIATAATVVFGGVGEMPFAAIGMIHSDPTDPMPIHEASTLLSGLDRRALNALLDAAGPGSGSSQVVVEIRQLGGRLADDVDSVLSHRDAAFNLLTIGLAIPDLLADTTARADQILASVGDLATGATLPNFGAGHSLRSIRSRYTPDKLQRLAQIAAAHDPHGVLPEARAVKAAATS